MKRSRAFLVVVVLALALLLPSAASALTYDQATDKLFADGYPQQLMEYLTSQGTSPEWGWATGGTPADNNRANYLADELRAMGLRVRLEPVPVDVLTFHSASVFVGSTQLHASTFGGVQPTPLGGVTGQVVYVGRGGDTAYLPGTDVDGKLVLIDEAITVPIWLSLPWVQADLKGAAGIIYCGSTANPAFFTDPASIGTLPSWYFYDAAPAVYISQNDADWLKAQVAGGATTATLVNDIEYQFAEDGGTGYNLVATMAGKQRGRRTIVSAHRDAYWHSALDDTAGCVSAVVMAKAMKMAGYKPDHDLVIFLTTNEEWGARDTLFSYGIGSWYAITKRHPNWAGTTSAFIGLDGPGQKDVLRIASSPEITSALADIAKDTALAPDGYLTPALGSSTDNWTFASAGVPGCNFRERTPEFYSKWYHTNMDTIDLVDYDALRTFQKYLQRVVLRFDEGLLPYNMTDRASHLAATVNGAALMAAGVDPASADRLVAGVAEFQARAAAYQARASAIRQTDAANKQLMHIVKRMDSSWTSLAADGSVWYPHQQVLKDTQAIDAALLALAAGDGTGARAALMGVALTGLFKDYSQEAYAKILTLHQPWSPSLTWNVDIEALTHMAPIPNVRPVVALIDAGDLEGATAMLAPMRDAEVGVLSQRVDDIAATLDWVNVHLATVK